MALSMGSQGEAVARIQTALTERGFELGPADGSFGPSTIDAVKSFQTEQGLAADGIVGAQTWSALGLTGQVPSSRPSTRPVRID